MSVQRPMAAGGSSKSKQITGPNATTGWEGTARREAPLDR